MRYYNDMFHHMFKAEFATLVSLKVPSGIGSSNCEAGKKKKKTDTHL